MFKNYKFSKFSSIKIGNIQDLHFSVWETKQDTFTNQNLLIRRPIVPEFTYIFTLITLFYQSIHSQSFFV